ncbi:hypothetical protein COS55_00635 [Candidatus Shapirobacteria bacterium CG03_land_8_20_14_0_80_40_19]|uniref:Nucleotidyl transferase AbiEii/AbiGii toxin family protein n=3 Tax=Candidatus Shapironibacteriota TaxID=1752721 RepID=A0A2M7BG51_9BACT|nr:MAG: hypothetical protein COS55_00635 [Candidatus Shapirobacteria bacterium CG03_land_8_20_14_0_80_40_19]PJC29307.1 MAG: hypothetical protein CO053_00270 [Candidatus Shapirobacteria bacterium CG_4_9_14_0_2_um_filter_40_11]PJC75892.1 MAG: hypothetical protein CO010_04185 [Candidatus Shapirobacteria bacterium CG_4_8_14_3_um_filter_39_11]
MIKLHTQILNENQKKVLPKLTFLKDNNIYLAGGTALALHLGHRSSLDFDFYTKSHFDSVMLYKKIEDIFGNDAILSLKEEDTMFCKVFGVDLSFFWYKYPLIDKLVKFESILLASFADIAAMKLIAVYQRPAKRDYIDIYFLLKIFTLKEMFSFVKKKYPNFNQYFALRALTYFEDLKDEEGRKIEIIDKEFSWEKAKDDIFEKVREYQLDMIKKRYT